VRPGSHSAAAGAAGTYYKGPPSPARGLFYHAGLTLLVAALFAGGPLGASCGTNGQPDGGTDADAQADAGCTKREDCPGGAVCVDGDCTSCTRDRDCRPTELCHPIKRACEFKQCWGDACATHADCPLGRFCVQGLCLDPDQPTAEGCQVAICDQDLQCGEGQKCSPTNNVCEEDIGCQSDADCGAGLRCNPGTLKCEATCTDETSGELCPHGWSCVEGGCAECTSNDACGGSRTCNPITFRCEGFNFCQTSRDCTVPLVCNRGTRQCTERPGPCSSTDDCPLEEVCQLSTGRCVSAACAADRYEPNTSFDLAPEISPGDVSQLTLCQGDVDYFKLTLGRGDRIQTVVEVDPLLNFSIELLDGAAALLAAGDYVVDRTVNADGDYYLRCRSEDPYVKYGLRIMVSKGVPCDDDDDEPNNDRVHATPLSAGQYPLALCAADADWYAVQVPRGQKLKVSLQHTPTEGDLDLYLYDSDGATLLDQSATAQEIEVVETATTTAGVAYVKVVGGTTSAQNTYDLFVTLEAIP
jgi:hypothetical protein